MAIWNVAAESMVAEEVSTKGSDEALMHPRQCVHEYPLGDELVLYAEDLGRLYHANTTAAFIWHGIRAGLKHQDIVMLLTEAFNISKENLACPRLSPNRRMIFCNS